MKTEFQYIRFIKILEREWQCENKKGDLLGDVVWMKAWKQWVFQPLGDTEYSEGCLRDIADFIKGLGKPE